MLEPDRTQIDAFANAVLQYAGTEGFMSVRSFYEGATKPFRITPVSLAGGLDFICEVAEDDARRAANEPKPVVFCPPLGVFATRDNATQENLRKGLTLSVECDQRPREAIAMLERVLGPATIVVRSGGYWIDPTTGQIF